MTVYCVVSTERWTRYRGWSLKPLTFVIISLWGVTCSRSGSLAERPDSKDWAVSIRNYALCVTNEEISAHKFYPQYHKQAYIKIDCAIYVLFLIICRPGLSWCGLMSHEIKGCICRHSLLIPLFPIISRLINHKICPKPIGSIWKNDTTKSGTLYHKAAHEIRGFHNIGNVSIGLLGCRPVP
jgi:hypothetical protein